MSLSHILSSSTGVFLTRPAPSCDHRPRGCTCDPCIKYGLSSNMLALITSVCDHRPRGCTSMNRLTGSSGHLRSRKAKALS